MKKKMSKLNQKFAALVAATALSFSLTACIGGEGKGDGNGENGLPGGNEPSLSPAEVEAAHEKLKGILDENIPAFVNNLEDLIIKNDALHELGLLIDGKYFDPREESSEGEGPSEEELHLAIQYLIANASAEGDAVVYTPDSRICSEVLAKNNPEDCIRMMGRVRLEQKLNAVGGRIEFYLDNYRPVVAEYQGDAVDFDFDMNEINAVSRVVDEETDPEKLNYGIGETLDGKVRVNIERPAVGQLNVTASVLSEVYFRGHIDQPEDFRPEVRIAETDELIKLMFRALQGAVAAQVNTAAISVLVQIYDHNDAEHALNIQIDRLSLMLMASEASNVVVASGLDVQEGEVRFVVDGAESLVFNGIAGAAALKFFEGRFEVQLNGFDLDATLSDPHGIFGGFGTFSISAPQFAHLIIFPEEPHVFDAGSLTVAGTEDLEGSLNLSGTISNPQCFGGNTDESTEFPLEGKACL